MTASERTRLGNLIAGLIVAVAVVGIVLVGNIVG